MTDKISFRKTYTLPAPVTVNNRTYSRSLWDAVLNSSTDPIKRFFPVKESQMILDIEGYSQSILRITGIPKGTLVTLSGVIQDTSDMMRMQKMNEVRIRRQFINRFFPLKEQEV